MGCNASYVRIIHGAHGDDHANRIVNRFVVEIFVHTLRVPEIKSSFMSPLADC